MFPANTFILQDNSCCGTRKLLSQFRLSTFSIKSSTRFTSFFQRKDKWSFHFSEKLEITLLIIYEKMLTSYTDDLGNWRDVRKFYDQGFLSWRVSYLAFSWTPQVKFFAQSLLKYKRQWHWTLLQTSRKAWASSNLFEKFIFCDKINHSILMTRLCMPDIAFS